MSFRGAGRISIPVSRRRGACHTSASGHVETGCPVAYCGGLCGGHPVTAPAVTLTDGAPQRTSQIRRSGRRAATGPGSLGIDVVRAKTTSTQVTWHLSTRDDDSAYAGPQLSTLRDRHRAAGEHCGEQTCALNDPEPRSTTPNGSPPTCGNHISQVGAVCCPWFTPKRSLVGLLTAVHGATATQWFAVCVIEPGFWWPEFAGHCADVAS